MNRRPGGKMRRFTIVTGLAGLLAILATGVAVAAVNWTIALKPGPVYPTATGNSQYQSQGAQRELQVEVDHLKTLAGKKVNVFVNGSRWASPIVSSLGVAQVDRNTDRGQSVPSVAHGSTVRIRTLGGTLIAAGTY
jgi:hypothetical protein